MTQPAAGDDFDVAKKVYDLLKSVPKDRQARVLRWVSETLGIAQAGAAIPAPLVSPAAQGAGTMPVPAPQMQGAAGQAPPGAVKDIRAFVSEKAPQSDNQFAAVVAYYYRFEAPPSHRKNTIGGADLQEAARLAGRRRLANPRQTLKNAKNMGYLNNIDRGQFAINTVGENLVVMTLPGGAGDVTAAAPRQRPRRPTGRKRK